MLKRRPLNKNQNGQAQQPAPQGQTPPQGQSQQPTRQGQPPQGQGQNQGQRRNRKNRNQQGNRQGGQGQQQGQRQGGQHRHGQNRRPHRPPPPPAYMQRDLLLIANKETVKSIEEVRLRFDPLSKKIPAHVTLLLPEPAAKITTDLLKKTDTKELPSLKELTFSSIQIIDDMYLWLLPDEESAQKLNSWHQLFAKDLAGHTQGEKFEPHITLGYIPRKLPEEDALAFAQNLITTPITLRFDNLLLEEFSEDQNSRSLDKVVFN